MSVTNFLNHCFDSGLDFSNVEIDDFIHCVKRLANILGKASDDSRKAVRERKFNSMLASQVYLSERFNPKTIHDYYSFTCKNVQIDVIIRGSVFGVSVIGWIPDVKHLIELFNLRNLNDMFSFEYIDDSNIKNFVHQTSNVWFFHGDTEHFGLNEHGLNNILHIWHHLVIWYLGVCKDVQ